MMTHHWLRELRQQVSDCLGHTVTDRIDGLGPTKGVGIGPWGLAWLPPPRRAVEGSSQAPSAGFCGCQSKRWPFRQSHGATN